MSSYRNEVEILSQHKTPTKRQNIAASFVSPIAFNTTAMDTRMQIDTTTS